MKGQCDVQHGTYISVCVVQYVQYCLQYVPMLDSVLVFAALGYNSPVRTQLQYDVEWVLRLFAYCRVIASR